ncbi:MAG: RNA polymerase sigma factor [Gemmatimonadaceae bacterium]
MTQRPHRVPALDFTARSDEQLAVERVREGDALALEMIFTAFREELLAHARQIVQSPAVAEEVVQDVFLAIWMAREHWSIRTSLRAYLWRAVQNVATRAGASRTRGPARGILLEHAERAVPARFADSAVAPDRRAENSALADAVEQATRIMPRRAREVFTLRHLHDLSNRDIASVLGISLKTVETHMTRALSTLRKRLAGWRDSG